MDQNAPTAPLMERGFTRITEGLVHLRSMPGDGLPLLMIHASPASARGLEPLMEALKTAGVTGPLLAPDTLGNGDRKSTRLNSSHSQQSRMPSSA